jgi:hypothetical protein
MTRRQTMLFDAESRLVDDPLPEVRAILNG